MTELGRIDEDAYAQQLAAERAARASMETRNRSLEDANALLGAALAESRELTIRAAESERREKLARQRAEQLQTLASALSQARMPEEVADAAIERAQIVFEQAAGVVIGCCDEDNGILELIRATDMAPEVFEQWRRIPISAATPLTDACRTATPIFLESPENWRALYPALMAVLDATPHRAQMVVPLIAAGRSVGAIGLAFREPRVFSEDEREFVNSIAAQCAIALERARLFKAERDARSAAERANRAKMDFLAAMSHELRTPLTAIAGHVDLISMQLHGPINDEQRDALGRVKRAQQHLLGVIDDLLNFARIQHGKIEFHLTRVVIADVVDDITPMIHAQIVANGLQYHAKLDRRIQATADRGKLAQILLNLLGNAVKFTPAGGRMELTVSNSAEGPLVHVTNSGPGIPPEKVDAVFDPFVQLDTSPSARRQGTGLGLAISRDLARGMGGDLTVASVPGKSTTFTLRLSAVD